MKASREIVAALLFTGLSLPFVYGQQTSPSPAQTGQVPPGEAPPAPESSPSMVDEIERLLREREDAEAAEAAKMDPSQPRTHRFTNQPLPRVLRVLAEQANINYIEPNFTGEERISVTLTNLTPIQAFRDIAEARGFEVLAEGNRYTLRRSDILSPSFFVTRRYRISHTPAEFLLQPVANFLGVKITPADDTFPGYPKPANTPTESTNAFSNVAGGTGTDQSRPRYTPGLPFDSPLSTGGFGQGEQSAVFVERSSNSLVVRATSADHDFIAAQIAQLDRKEQQILIKTYVIDVIDSSGTGGGLDWSQTLGFGPGQGATFSLTGNLGTPPPGQSITGAINPGAFFSNGLVLNLSDVAVTLRALQEEGRIKSNNSPMTVAKSGMPVTIRSDSQQTVFLQTPGSQEYGPSTQPYTFTTGLTIDLVARILDDGLIDLNLNPTLSSAVAQTDSGLQTNVTVPVIATRSTTANVTVRSGQAAVIGGILQDSSTFDKNGIPGLRKIPVLGYLFKSRTRSDQRTNLIIVVSPTIIPADNRRRDRLGESEQEILQRSYDLPGEPPPLPLGATTKQVPVRLMKGRENSEASAKTTTKRERVRTQRQRVRAHKAP
jgi:Flp pilus assembly secretin CpaC